MKALKKKKKRMNEKVLNFKLNISVNKKFNFCGIKNVPQKRILALLLSG